MAAALAAVVAAAARVDRPEAELQRLLSVLPGRIAGGLVHLQHHRGRRLEEQLVEVVLDLGRRPVARFPDGDCAISDDPVSAADIEDALCCVGDFGDDNRAGIDRTLHRVSAIRNRAGRVVGLTCRVGRAVRGSADMARDLVATGGSLLLMGPPGVGKTTAIREIARLLADEYDRRVVIVDTSNEIAGDGDIPHPGIGRARRMQVSNVEQQHMVMIEAVENHMPETIVIDEIGTELEALAAVTIAQRGVQLVATAHGTSLDNLIKNPSLEMLAGGIQSVTLGDEEARRRGVQKSVLERKGQPSFTSAIEMLSRTEWRIHHSLAATTDALLAGQPPAVEMRRSAAELDDWSGSNSEEVQDGGEHEQTCQQRGGGGPFLLYSYQVAATSKCLSKLPHYWQVSEDLLKQAIQVIELQNELSVTSDIAAANAIMTLRSKLRDNMWLRSIAKLRQLPILAVKANTLAQMVRATRTLLEMELIQAPTISNAKLEDEIDALEEARLAIEHIVIAKGQPVELLPRCADLVALQIRLAHSYQLASEVLAGSHSTVQRVRVLPRLPTRQQEPRQEPESEFEGGKEGTHRLPILPQ